MCITGSDRPQLRLILKVPGPGSSTPEAEQCDNSANLLQQQQAAAAASHTPYVGEDEARNSEGGEKERHKKKKEKKKKKNKDKDKEKDKDKDKERKKHKHHHKVIPRPKSTFRFILTNDSFKQEKKHRDKEEPMSQGDESMHYEVVSVQPSRLSAATSPRPILKISSTPNASAAPGEQGTPSVAPLGSRGLRTSLRPRQERPVLQKLLELLLAGLERKDPRQFFAWPVTDSIAPGYSSIITKPMDFSTMRQKIEDNEYRSVQEFTDDFTLMCNNAVVYNQPDTIYYKAAKRLLHAGLRTLSADKVRPLVPTVSYFGELTTQQLGFEPLEESFRAFLSRQQNQSAENADGDVEMGFSSGGETNVETARDIFLKNETTPGATSGAANQFEVLPDDMTPDEILEQVQEAVQVAAVKLESQHPSAKMGFLRQRKDGTTSLAILAPCDPGQEPGSTQIPVTLGVLTGKVQPGPGTGYLAGFREDRRNLAKPVKPLYYGPFGSYAPSCDSTFANLTKEESDLVHSTYGEDTGTQYAESILDFVRDCDYTLNMADDLLNLMTHGEHSAVAKILDEKRKAYQLQQQQIRLAQQQQQQFNKELDSDIINFSSLRSLSDLGIDVSFLDTFGKAPLFSFAASRDHQVD